MQTVLLMLYSVHTALLIRDELFASPGHTGLNVSRSDAAKVVTNKLHIFLSVLLGDAQEPNSEVDNTTTVEDNDNNLNAKVELSNDATMKNNRIVSIAQDIIHSVSRGKKWTPKLI